MSEERADYSEPMPTAGMDDVAPVADALIADVTARQDAKGLQRYGQPLRTWDGRDVWNDDALPEYVDLGRYLCKAKMQYDDIVAENRRLRQQIAELKAIARKAEVLIEGEAIFCGKWDAEGLLSDIYLALDEGEEGTSMK